jgi:hypothetical protein
MSAPITGEGEMSTNEMRRLRRVITAVNQEGATDGESGQQIVRELHHYHSDGGAFAKLKDALLLAAILGLVAVVWNMSINVGKLETAFDGLTKVVATLESKIK